MISSTHGQQIFNRDVQFLDSENVAPLQYLLLKQPGICLLTTRLKMNCRPEHEAQYCKVIGFFTKWGERL